MKKDELERQLFHVLAGMIALAVLLLLGKGMLMGMMFFIILIGLLFINQTFLGRKIGLVEWFVGRFERTNVPFVGWGSACYATGVLMAAAFLGSVDMVAATIMIMAFGDAASTIIGRMGEIRLPYNRKKTLEGAIAFYTASLVGYFFVGNAIFPVALAGALVESLDLPFDDNITVPIATTIVFLVI